MVVYSPVIGGRPASSAYAIPCGTSSAVRTNPATRSWRSHPRSYDRMLAMPGATRAITGSVCVVASGMDHIVATMALPSPGASTATMPVSEPFDERTGIAPARELRGWRGLGESLGLQRLELLLVDGP